jgi:tetratricopeptide (TPR) repeat protein
MDTTFAASRLFRLSWLLLVLATLNGAYLFTHPDPSLFYFANVVLHLALGGALVLAGAALWAKGHRPGWVLAAPLAILALCALTGLGLIALGAPRPYRWLLHLHVAAAVAGTVPLLLVLAWRAAHGALRPLAAVGLVGAVAGAAFALHDRQWEERRFRIENPARPPASMDGEGEGPQGAFFPSSVKTAHGGKIPGTFFLKSEDCARCHKDIYDQWNSSVHHFSSFNNQWYRRTIEYMQDTVGTKPPKWCAGCHDHALLFEGLMDVPIKGQLDNPRAHAGLACVSCHSIVHVESTMGQGHFTIEYPPLHDLATSKNPLLEWAHDTLLEIDPRPHREVFLKSFHREQAAEFCVTCHKVHLDVPVNDYRWLRGFNEYDNWQASGVSGQGARSFYYPPKSQNCRDCHMPLVASNDPAAKNGFVRSHRFPGANTALPFVNQDQEQLRVTQEFLRGGQVTLDVFGLVRTGDEGTQAARPVASGPEAASSFAVGEESAGFGARTAYLAGPGELTAPLGPVEGVVKRGESVRVDVVVRTRGVGHFFPGGTVDGFDVWVSLEAVDETGRTLYHSGRVADDGRGPVEPGAHFYRALMLDAHGNLINKRNAFMTRTLAYVRLIPPGAADTVHFRLDVPKDCGERIELRARLNYRKFAWWYTQWAFAGVRDPADPSPAVASGYDDGRWVFTGDTSSVSGKIKAIPDIPITVMAEAEATLRVLPATAPPPEPRQAKQDLLRERWNDYGIGLLLQGDIRGAEAAFLAVTEMDPEYPDGWVNVARARLQESDIDGAAAVLDKALERVPDLPRAHFFKAATLKPKGRYDEALEHLEKARAAFPRDRVILNEIGRILFLKREHQRAVEVLEQVLRIDPEDLQAHYNLMLCYRGLDQKERAREHEAYYRRFKADESAEFITGAFRKLNPNDNNERQAIHEHGSAPLGPAS